MAKNIEIKASLEDKKSVIQKLELLSDSSKSIILNQVDEFYYVPFGRLKLRNINIGYNELIFYIRSNTNNAKKSRYIRIPIAFPKVIKALLRKFLGVKGIVEKVRTVFFIDNIRVHIDDVNLIGSFIEIEYVAGKGHKLQDGYEIVNSLMNSLNITENKLSSGAYLDIMVENAHQSVHSIIQ